MTDESRVSPPPSPGGGQRPALSSEATLAQLVALNVRLETLRVEVDRRLRLAWWHGLWRLVMVYLLLWLMTALVLHASACGRG
jgi:hypothetical protein